MEREGIAKDMTALIGGTPMLALTRFAAEYAPGARIAAKLEAFNPGGSAKDRIALSMIRAAEAEGRLKPGGCVIEPTSGNTGIGIAAICASLGYRAVVVMPDSMSVERQKLIAAYGAELVLTPGALGMSGAVAEAERICAAREGSVIAGQFANPANPAAHYATTGPEIWRDAEGDIAALVAGIGSGGTLSGAGRYLKERKTDVRVVGVEPADSPLLSRGFSGAHGIQGIGANFVPKALDRDVLDEVIAVPTQGALDMARALARREGVLCGISGGAALWAAVELAKRGERGRIVVVLPDGGERYLSSALFA